MQPYPVRLLGEQVFCDVLQWPDHSCQVWMESNVEDRHPSCPSAGLIAMLEVSDFGHLMTAENNFAEVSFPTSFRVSVWSWQVRGNSMLLPLCISSA